MKISKSKQELARIISENGGWRDGEFAAQDGDGGVGGYGVKPEWDSQAKYWWREALGVWFSVNKINNHHQAALSRAEYFHLYPAPDADGWIEWKGGECPVNKGVLVDVRYRNGKENIGVAALLYRKDDGFASGRESGDYDLAVDWSIDGHDGDITAYRLHKHEHAEQEYPAGIKPIDPAKQEPTIEQLAADYRNAKDYAELKRDEADDAKADADAKLKALELAGEALGLLVSPISAKQEPELVITDWRDLRVGDVVEVTGSSNCRWHKVKGKELTVKSVRGDGASTGEWLVRGNTEFRFIRRP